MSPTRTSVNDSAGTVSQERHKPKQPTLHQFFQVKKPTTTIHAPTPHAQEEGAGEQLRLDDLWRCEELDHNFGDDLVVKENSRTF